jgi:hypothetical protein
MKRSFVTITDRETTIAADPAMPPRGTLSVHLDDKSEIAGVYYCTPEGHLTSELTEDAQRVLARVDDTVRDRCKTLARADLEARAALELADEKR